MTAKVLGDYGRPSFSSTDLFIAVNLTADAGFFMTMLLAGLIWIFLRWLLRVIVVWGRSCKTPSLASGCDKWMLISLAVSYFWNEFNSSGIGSSLATLSGEMESPYCRLFLTALAHRCRSLCCFMERRDYRLRADVSETSKEPVPKASSCLFSNLVSNNAGSYTIWCPTIV